MNTMEARKWVRSPCVRRKKRSYDLTLKREDGTFSGRVVYDAKGMLLERREVLQQGTVVYRRVK